jgi:signal transduction histidine kinase
MLIFSTLRSQFVAVVTAAVVLSNIGVIGIVEGARQRQLETERLYAAAERIASIFRYLSTLPQSQRATAVTAVSRNVFQYSVSAIPPMGNHSMNETERSIAFHVESREPLHRFGSAVARLVQPYYPVLGDRRTRLEIMQPISTTGEWLLARFNGPPTPSPTPVMLIAAAICTIVTGSAAAWIAERISRPLLRLAMAANEVARGRGVPRLSPGGPKDFQRTAEAFNMMSERVAFTLQTQRNVLAAVGHDLRTPIAAMRISAEFVRDEMVRDRLIGDLDEVQSLTEKILRRSKAEYAA